MVRVYAWVVVSLIGLLLTHPASALAQDMPSKALISECAGKIKQKYERSTTNSYGIKSGGETVSIRGGDTYFWSSPQCKAGTVSKVDIGSNVCFPLYAETRGTETFGGRATASFLCVTDKKSVLGFELKKR